MAVMILPLDGPVLPESLTRAEREVAHALLEGLSNAEIAERRGTSQHTVANQVSTLFHKMKVGSRAEFLVAMGRLQRS
jgi:DNA-binding NarL/FixJ family response regulator